MENELQVIREQEIEACLIELRGQKVLLDICPRVGLLGHTVVLRLDF